ncbi:hypothetical protein ACXOZG_03445 [Lactobacillus delbrueckii subsp. bulgaricus]|uniref:hypothetical protein n=1 Tax=Lactobacillus delbrueckii TaxID=1584 RepID=UPI002073E624|nr:hypothetical protein [Lactobacillus delbrueckii]
MRFRRFFTAAATAAFGLAFTFGQGQTAQASINSDAKKTTYSGTKSLETLLKAAGLSYNQFNSVANGKKYGSRFGYRKGSSFTKRRPQVQRPGKKAAISTTTG